MPEEIRFYLDQMIPRNAANNLRAQGYDVIRASELKQSDSDDDEILETAGKLGRVLITLDSHFGDWTVLPLCRHNGVIRVKVHPTTEENMLSVLTPFLKKINADQMKNHLVILYPNRDKWILTAK